MVIDLAIETPITLSDVRRHPLVVRPGRTIAPSTVWRWIHRGCHAATGNRVRLECYRAGGRTMTTVEALRRFIQALSAPAETAAPDTWDVRRHRDGQLVAAGLLPAPAGESGA